MYRFDGIKEDALLCLRCGIESARRPTEFMSFHNGDKFPVSTGHVTGCPWWRRCDFNAG